ncbi:MAG TPA: VanW family protein [Syntrophomonadaceae bacterium]|nr:VanW family protein [Syntrophomonadaceae bacterium]
MKKALKLFVINHIIIISIAVALGLHGAAGATSMPSQTKQEEPVIQQITDDQKIQGSSLLINGQTLDLKTKPVVFIDDSSAELLSLLNLSNTNNSPYIVIKESSILRPEGISYYLGNEKWTYPSVICCVDNQVRGYMYAEAQTYLESLRYNQPVAEVSYPNILSSPDNVNAKLAAEQFNGAIIKPKQEFSFYSCVNTSLEEGYQEGTVLVETEEGTTETDQQMGGGICKTATLLHKVVDKLGLEETERHNHTEPVSYADPGDDASVSKGGWDYKFINTLDMPIKIVAYQDQDNLVVEIYIVPVI